MTAIATNFNQNTKWINIGYWVVTGFFAVALFMAGVMDLLLPPDIVAVMVHLGYPLYFATILGVAKILGAIALLYPGFPTLKEWAYAGFTFDLLGAVISHLASGDSIGEAGAPLFLLIVMFGSYTLYHLRSKN